MSPSSAETMVPQASAPNRAGHGHFAEQDGGKAGGEDEGGGHECGADGDNERRTAAWTSPSTVSSCWNRLRKWIVSSTAIPRQMVKAQTLVICSGRPEATRAAEVTTKGKRLGMTLMSPRRRERRAKDMMPKMMTEARADAGGKVANHVVEDATADEWPAGEAKLETVVAVLEVGQFAFDACVDRFVVGVASVLDAGGDESAADVGTEHTADEFPAARRRACRRAMRADPRRVPTRAGRERRGGSGGRGDDRRRLGRRGWRR